MVMTMARVSLPKRDSSADFEIRSDMRTLQTAEEIMKDPKRLSRVKVMAKKESDSLKDIGKGLRQMRGK
jgi:hypothetical protein